MPRIDMAKCDLCGLCLTVCSCRAIVRVGNILKVVETEECGWCTWCEAVCPRGAISCAFEIVFEDAEG